MTRKKILVADDDRDLVELIQSRLEHNGFDTYAAHEGVRTIEMAIKIRPDLIILDYRMPAGTGENVLKTLRHRLETKHIPVFVLTGVDDERIKNDFEIMGIQGFLEKPCDFEKLMTQISTVLT